MISYPHRCIFVHIPKTGGTSIENMIWPQTDLRTIRDLWMGFTDKYHNKYQTGGLQHLLAEQIRTEVGADVFRSCFKFSIVRNPWDRVVSQYTFMKKREDLRDFIGMRNDDSLKSYLQLLHKKKHVQWEQQVTFLQDANGHSLVDYIGRFECFERSVREVMSQIGIQASTIPHENRGQREPYWKYYDSEARDMVASMYAADIAAFGYTFDEPQQFVPGS